MNKGRFFRCILSILFLGFCVYSYLDMQNEITDLRIRIPRLMSEVRRIEEENTHLRFDIESFESPENLMKIAMQSEFAHLKFPMCKDVLTLKQAEPLKEPVLKTVPELKINPTITFATGANP